MCVCVLRVVVDLLVMEVEQRLSEAFRKLLAAISDAKKPLNTNKNNGFCVLFGKRRFRPLESFKSLLEFGFGPVWVLVGKSFNSAQIIIHRVVLVFVKELQ